MRKKLTALFVVLLSFYSAFADTFVVTSNADSGAGTLREAITRANTNGTAAADSIAFNLPDVSEAGRTIILITELPPLSSNIIIDGSTQPGSVLGISTAKVTLYLAHYPPVPFNFLYILNATDVKVYGLCFKFFANPDAAGGSHYAIYLRNSSRITVGGPGRGNLFSAVRYGITNTYWNYHTDAIQAVTIQSNVFGLNSANLAVKRGIVDLVRASEITLGGPLPEEGNMFVGASVLLSQSNQSNMNFFAKVQNNKMDVNWSGTNYYRAGCSITLRGNNLYDDTTSTKTMVLDNVLSSDSWPGGISLNQLGHKAVVQGNKIGTDLTGTRCMAAYTDLGIYDCKKVIVGGYSPTEENLIGGDVYTTSRGAHLIKNKFGDISIVGAIGTGDPFVKIVTYNNGLITGKANASAKIQLYTNICHADCLNRQYLTTVYANASGDWSFPYTPDMPNIIATATTADSSTSAFTKPQVNHLNRKITKATCGKSNGSITGIVVTEGTHIKWLDSYTLKVVSTDTNLVNVPAGAYVLNVYNGENGCPWSVNFSIYEESVPPNIATTVVDASCGQNNGTLFQTYPNYSLSYKWLNSAGDSIGSNYYINNLAPGTYSLKAWIPYDTSCNNTYGPFEVKNLTGASLNTSNIQINPSLCGGTNGSIKGIAGENVSGSAFLQWVDSLNRPVGSSYDLVNVRAGKYRLKFKDAGNCDTIVTAYYLVPEVGIIAIDTMQKVVTASSCTGPTGSIRQLNVAGGNSYQWINTATNASAGTAVDALHLPPGNYQLTVSNQYGCTQKSPVISVPQASFAALAVTGFTVKNAYCNQDNGLVKINSFSRDSSLYSFRWMDSTSGKTIGLGISVFNLGAGTYQLMATDQNGCELGVFASSIVLLPPPSFDYTQMQVQNDRCNLQMAGISQLKINGLTGPAVYTWYNQDNKVAGNNINLQNAGAGTYVLKVMDDGVCAVQSAPVVLTNKDDAQAKPLYDDLVIPRHSDAVLRIKNPAAGTYHLYSNVAAASPAQQNSSGNFVVPAIGSDTSFYIQRMYGSCASALARVQVRVVDQSYFAIPTAFTPNSDGLNDRLSVKVIGYMELKYFKIFNRWGQLVFETSRINDGWDGKLTGVLQNAGVYVWVAEGKDIEGRVKTGKGSFVLVR